MKMREDVEKQCERIKKQIQRQWVFDQIKERRSDIGAKISLFTRNTNNMP